MGIAIYTSIALPLFLVAFLGLVGLYRRKLIISSKRELSGTPMLLFSLSYLLIGILGFIKVFYFTGDIVIDFPVIGIVVLIVTIFFMSFSKPRSV